MLKLKLFSLYIFFKTIICPCHKYEKRQLETIGQSTLSKSVKLPVELNECSGLIALDSATFLSNNDGGGKPEIYLINTNQVVLKTYPFPCKNIDWEEIATNHLGNYFIGDIGNNANQRRDLCIYKVNNKLDTLLETIHFQYEDQLAFPPQRIERNFDAEAFFAYGDSLFLFSKNRGKGKAKLYKLSQNGNNQIARIHQTLEIKGMITGCAYNNSTKVCAVLTYGKILFYKLIDSNKIITLKFISCRKFPASGQSEAITFINDHLLAISNENGKLYFFRINKNL